MTTVALMVSGHGYGHSMRCAQVARALLQRDARVLVRSDAPRWLYPDGIEWLESEGLLDIGVVQHDGLEMDIDETRRRWTGFARSFDAAADDEAEALHHARVDVVLGDIPPVAFAAAAIAGIPGAGMTNFAWDWIYSAWDGFEEIVAAIRHAYSEADVLYRLPLHGDKAEAFPAFRRIEDVPLIARRARRQRSEVRHELGLPEEAKVVLLSFGGFSARGLDFEAFGRWRDYVFVTTPPMRVDQSPTNLRVLNEAPADYVSLLAACDAVVTKPGYGMVADCLANRVPMLFTDRGPFREYDVLAAALPRLGRACYIPRDALIRGELGPFLEALFASRTPWTEEPMNGADVVAEKLLTLGRPQSAR